MFEASPALSIFLRPDHRSQRGEEEAVKKGGTTNRQIDNSPSRRLRWTTRTQAGLFSLHREEFRGGGRCTRRRICLLLQLLLSCRAAAEDGTRRERTTMGNLQRGAAPPPHHHLPRRRSRNASTSTPGPSTGASMTMVLLVLVALSALQILHCSAGNLHAEAGQKVAERRSGYEAKNDHGGDRSPSPRRSRPKLMRQRAVSEEEQVQDSSSPPDKTTHGEDSSSPPDKTRLARPNAVNNKKDSHSANEGEEQRNRVKNGGRVERQDAMRRNGARGRATDPQKSPKNGKKRQETP